MEFTVPKAASLVNFVYNISDAFEEGKNDTAFASYVDSEKLEIYTTTTALAPINFLKETGLGKSITLCSISSEHNPIQNALDLLFFASLYSAGAQELKTNAKPLFAAIKGGDPDLAAKVYALLDVWSAEHENFYAPAARAKTQLAASFKARAAERKIGPVIRKIDHFTGRHWPVGVPFTVGLVPVPPDSTSGVGGRTYATAIHIPVNLRHMRNSYYGYMDGKLGIVVHEVFHSMLGQYLNRCQVKKALADLGRALHTVQDFYAHSNYAEKASLNTVSIDLLKITKNPDPDEKCYNNERFADLTTGYYPAGIEYKLGLPHKCNHDSTKTKKGLSKDALSVRDPFFRLARVGALKDTKRIVQAMESVFAAKCGTGARCRTLLDRFKNLDPQDDVMSSCTGTAAAPN